MDLHKAGCPRSQGGQGSRGKVREINSGQGSLGKVREFGNFREKSGKIGILASLKKIVRFLLFWPI